MVGIIRTHKSEGILGCPQLLKVLPQGAMGYGKKTNAISICGKLAAPCGQYLE